MEEKREKKALARAYGEYVKQFTPKPKYLLSSIKAFVCGGLLCCLALWLSNFMQSKGMSEEDSSSFITICIIMSAQLLTGFGVFDKIAKVFGAGVIVPISGFANSMVAPAIEYKKEGPVLGAGSKMFSVAGPVLVLGITVSTIIGLIYLLVF